jgi:cation transport ATPase
MVTFNQFLPISSACKFFVLLALTFLLVNIGVVNAQVNTNSPNSNNSSANVNANVNSNANANANTNANANSNTKANQNDNANDNSNQNKAEQARQTELTGSFWFPASIILMFAAVLLGFGYTITRAIRFSKETFRSPTGMPEGSLRAMLAFMLVTFLGFYVLASILSFSAFKLPEALLGIIATVIGFYFGSRTSEEAPPRSLAPSRETYWIRLA